MVWVPWWESPTKYPFLRDFEKLETQNIPNRWVRFGLFLGSVATFSYLVYFSHPLRTRLSRTYSNTSLEELKRRTAAADTVLAAHLQDAVQRPWRQELARHPDDSHSPEHHHHHQ